MKKMLFILMAAACVLSACDDNDAKDPSSNAPSTKPDNNVNPWANPNPDCKLGETLPCYEGPEGTADVGICKSGYYKCIENSIRGAIWDRSECIGQVVPDYRYVCDKNEPLRDNDCDGTPDTEQDDDGDGLTICTKDGMRGDCCDNKHMCADPLQRKLRAASDDCLGNNFDDNCRGGVDEDVRLCTAYEYSKEYFESQNASSASAPSFSSMHCDRTNVNLPDGKSVEVCKCKSGYSDADGDVSNGCEAATTGSCTNGNWRICLPKGMNESVLAYKTPGKRTGQTKYDTRGEVSWNKKSDLEDYVRNGAFGICTTGVQQCQGGVWSLCLPYEGIPIVGPRKAGKDFVCDASAKDGLGIIDNDCNGVDDRYQDEDGDGVPICDSTNPTRKNAVDCCDKRSMCGTSKPELVHGGYSKGGKTIAAVQECIAYDETGIKLDGLDEDCDGVVDNPGAKTCAKAPDIVEDIESTETCDDDLLPSFNTSGSAINNWSSDVSDKTEAGMKMARAMDICQGLVTAKLTAAGMPTQYVSYNQVGILEGMKGDSSRSICKPVINKSSINSNPPDRMCKTTKDACESFYAGDYRFVECFSKVISYKTQYCPKFYNTTNECETKVPTIPPQRGKNLIVMSSGQGKDPAHGKNTSSISIGYSGSVPSVYLAEHSRIPTFPGCSTAGTSANDTVQLHLELKAPDGAQGFQFDFRFYSHEYPYYTCSQYNDFFMAILTDKSGKAIQFDYNGTTIKDGNIAFDKNGNAVSVNNGFFSSCGAPSCSSSDMGYRQKQSCPPSITLGCGIDNRCGSCEDGYGDLYAFYSSPYTGSGNNSGGGGTAWLTTKVPISSGQEFNLDLYIWDTSDSMLDSTVIVDNFKWRYTKTTIGTDFAGKEDEDEVIEENHDGATSPDDKHEY